MDTAETVTEPCPGSGVLAIEGVPGGWSGATRCRVCLVRVGVVDGRWVGHLAPEREPEPEQTTVIPTAEEAARAAGSLRSQRALFSLAPSANWRSCTDALLPATIEVVLPLLDAIADGRVFEVRPERCTNCDGHGGEYIDHGDGWEDCARCDGSGYEPTLS